MIAQPLPADCIMPAELWQANDRATVAALGKEWAAIKVAYAEGIRAAKLAECRDACTRVRLSCLLFEQETLAMQAHSFHMADSPRRSEVEDQEKREIRMREIEAEIKGLTHAVL